MIYRLTAMNMGGACTGFAIPDVADSDTLKGVALTKVPRIALHWATKKLT